VRQGSTDGVAEGADDGAGACRARAAASAGVASRVKVLPSTTCTDPRAALGAGTACEPSTQELALRAGKEAPGP
jgi:hypothetical protein